MDRGIELVFCRIGTRRSTIAAAKSPKSSGFNFTVSSPAGIIFFFESAIWKQTKAEGVTVYTVLQVRNSMQRLLHEEHRTNSA